MMQQLNVVLANESIEPLLEVFVKTIKMKFLSWKSCGSCPPSYWYSFLFNNKFVKHADMIAVRRGAS